MPRCNTVIEYDRVSFRRDQRRILSDVSWQVRKGERWVLLGRNGSGKSTLLSMIPAYGYPTTGTVEVFGETFGRFPWEKIRARVCFVSSVLHRFSSTLHPMTAKEIVASGHYRTFGLHETPSAKVMADAETMLTDFHLAARCDTRFALLSEGERRRVLVARSLMHPAELLVLDEPCASLDLYERESLLQGLTGRMREERTLVYVTHNLEEIMPWITHAAVLADGRIRRAGKKKDILTPELLDEVFGVRTEITWEYDRPWVKILP